MKSELITSFVLLREELKKAVYSTEADVNLWKSYVDDIPYCELIEISGEDILYGVKFKGKINFWAWSEILNDYYDEEDDEFLDSLTPIRESLTAKFFFKEHNKAVLIYPPAEKLPKFKGTWAEVFLEMVDIIRRKFCADPKPPRKIPDMLKLFTPGNT